MNCRRGCSLLVFICMDEELVGVTVEVWLLFGSFSWSMCVNVYAPWCIYPRSLWRIEFNTDNISVMALFVNIPLTTPTPAYTACTTEFHLQTMIWRGLKADVKPESPHQSFLLYGHPFSSYRPFCDKFTELPQKGPWTLWFQRYTTYALIVPPSPKFQCVSSYDLPFSIAVHY